MISPQIPRLTNAKPLRSLGQAALTCKRGVPGPSCNAYKDLQGMGAGFPQAGFRFCTCMKGWHMSRESSIAGKVHQGMVQTSHRRDLGVGFVPSRVAGTCHGNPASQTAAGRKLHHGSLARFFCRTRWLEVRTSEKTLQPWRALEGPKGS